VKQGVRALLCPLLIAAQLFSAHAQNVAGVDPLGVAAREFRARNFDAALAAVDQAEKAGGATATSHDLRGCIQMEQGNLDAALASFKAAREADSTFVMASLHTGDALLRQKKWEEAREAYGRAMKETKILTLNERLRFGVLMTYLGAQDNTGAQRALDRIPFPTESAAYYFAQAAWSFSRGEKRAAKKWISTASDMFDESRTAWFARPLHDFGWIKSKPAPVLD
jgi:tetratricopeptide (TPR) repeat protein